MQSYQQFVNESLDYYDKIPQETSELYKRHYINIPFDLRNFENNPDNSSGLLANAVREWDEKLNIKFDVAFGSNESFVGKETFAKIVNMESMNNYDDGLYKSSEDKYVAYINSRTGKAIAIDVPDGKSASVNMLFLNSNMPLNSKVLINVGNGSKLNVFEYYGSSTDTSTSVGVMHEVHSGNDSEIELNALHNEDHNTVSLSHCRNISGENSHVRINSVYNGSAQTRIRNIIEAGSRNSRIEVNEMVFGSSSQKFDVGTYIINAAKHTNASLESKAALMDTSFCILKGFAKINKGAEKARSYVHERGILLDRGAKVDGLPDMAVDENDVKATHSSATSPVDPESVFYLMSRGIDDTGVKRLLVTGFFASGLSKINNNVMRELSMSVINSKLENKSYGNVPKLDTRNMWIGTANAGDEDMFKGHYKYRGT